MSRLRVIAVAWAVVALAVVAGCQAPERVVVTAADEDGTVRVRNGGVVLVELEGNPTTGYMWMERSVPPVLESVGEAESTRSRRVRAFSISRMCDRGRACSPRTRSR
jgi:hypothetical protein